MIKNSVENFVRMALAATLLDVYPNSRSTRERIERVSMHSFLETNGIGGVNRQTLLLALELSCAEPPKQAHAGDRAECAPIDKSGSVPGDEETFNDGSGW